MGAYQGIVTWTSFSSKADFDKWYTDEIRAREEVVEEGISQNRAMQLVDSTPLKCRIAAAKQDATEPDGTVNEFILEMELAKVAFVEQGVCSRMGVFNRGDTGDGIWENGWILPDGRFINCHYEDHIRCAEEVLGTTEKELEKTAVKVSCMPASVRLTTFGKMEYRPNFLTERKRMTKAQLKTIEKYCVKHGLRPPLDYFTQQDLDDMVGMETEQILAILAK